MKNYRGKKKAIFVKNVSFEKKHSVKAVEKKVKKLTKLVKHERELRYKDTYIPATSVLVSGSITLLNGMTTGDTINTREGPLASMLYMDINMNSIWGDLTNLYRILIIYDHDPQGVQIAIGDIFDNTAGAFSIQSPFNFNYIPGRLSILKDIMVNFSEQANPQHIYKKRFNLRGKKTNYNRGNTGLIGDISQGALYYVVISDSSGVPHPATGGCIRVWYTA